MLYLLSVVDVVVLLLPLPVTDDCAGGAIFDTFSRFVNAVASVDVAVDVTDDLVAVVTGGRALYIDTNLEPWTFFTCRIMPSGAMIWLHWLHNTIGPGSLGDTP